MNTYIKYSLNRISQTVVPHFRIPNFEFGNIEQVRPAYVNTQVFQFSFTGQPLWKRIAYFCRFHTQESTVTQPPCTRLVIITDSRIRQPWPESIHILVGLAPMIIGDNLKQSIVSLFSSQFVVRVIRLGKRSDTQRVNKEGRPCRSLEEAVKIRNFWNMILTLTICRP